MPLTLEDFPRLPFVLQAAEMKGPRANRKVKAQRHGRPSVRPARRRGPKKNQKAQGKKRLTEKRTREQQGGFLPKRPDIKGLDSDTGSKAARKKAERKFNKHAKKQVQAQNTDGDRENKDFKGAKGPQRPQERPRNGQLKDGALKGGRSGEEPRKRKLVNGQERLRAILDKFPHLLLPGETADAAVAACFKKAGNSNKAFETGPSECAENEAQGVSGDSQQRQQLSGSKRRKLLRLVINSKTAENKVFVHESYQLYNDILRSIRTAEGPGGASESSDSPGEPGAPRRNKDLKSLVKSAVNFLEGPLSRVRARFPILSWRLSAKLFLLMRGAANAFCSVSTLSIVPTLHDVCAHRRTATAAQRVSPKFV